MLEHNQSTNAQRIHQSIQTLCDHLKTDFSLEKLRRVLKLISSTNTLPYILFQELAELIKTNCVNIETTEIKQLNETFFINSAQPDYTQTAYIQWQTIIINIAQSSQNKEQRFTLLLMLVDNAKRLKNNLNYIEQLIRVATSYLELNDYELALLYLGITLKTASLYKLQFNTEQIKKIQDGFIRCCIPINLQYIDSFLNRYNETNSLAISVPLLNHLIAVYEALYRNLVLLDESTANDYSKKIYLITKNVFHSTMYQAIVKNEDERTAAINHVAHWILNIYKHWKEPGRNQYSIKSLEQLLDILNGDLSLVTNIVRTEFSNETLSDYENYFANNKNLFENIIAEVSEILSLSSHNQTVLQTEPEEVTTKNLLRYHKKLQKARKYLREITITPADTLIFNNTIVDLLNSYLLACIKQLGITPTPFRLLLTGSGGRSELAPHSDIEFFIVYLEPVHLKEKTEIEAFHDICKAYFMGLSTLLNYFLFLLGENAEILAKNGVVVNKRTRNETESCLGLRFDSAYTPLGKNGKRFIGTMDEIAHLLNIKAAGENDPFIDVNLISEGRVIFSQGSWSEFEASFKKLRLTALKKQSKLLTTELYRQAARELSDKALTNIINQSNINIKALRDTVVRLIKSMIFHFCPECEEISSSARLIYLQNHGYIAKPIFLILELFLNVVARIRYNNHLLYGTENDIVVVKNINAYDKATLLVTLHYILIPTLGRLLNDRSITDRIEALKDGKISVLAQALTSTNNISDDTPVNLIIDYLYKIPNNLGLRLNTTAENGSWEAVIEEALLEPYDEKKSQQYIKEKRIIVKWLKNNQTVSVGLLKRDIQTRFLNEQGHFDRRKPKNRLGGYAINGRRDVFYVTDSSEKIIAYLKANPETAGIQLAVDNFMHRVTGYGSYSNLCHFIPAWQQETSYPVLMSRPAGQSLLEIHNKKHSLETVEQKLHPHYFALGAIARFLLVLEDDKLDNIGDEHFIDENEQTWSRLVSFDAERAFELEVLEEDKKIKVNGKTAAFCFNQMTKISICLSAIEEFLRLEACGLLGDWLIHTLGLNKAIQFSLFTPETLTRFLGRPNIPPCYLNIYFESFATSEIYQRICRIQAQFKILLSSAEERKNHSLLSIFNNIASKWIDFYSLVHQSSLDIAKRFELLPTNYTLYFNPETHTYETVSTPRDLRKIPEGHSPVPNKLTTSLARKQRGLKEAKEQGQIIDPDAAHYELLAIHEQYQLIKSTLKLVQKNDISLLLHLIMRAKSNDQKNKICYYIIECIVNAIEFNQLIPENQTALFQAIAGIPFVELKIHASNQLTDTLLNNILTYCHELVLLDISGCKNPYLKGKFTANFVNAPEETLRTLILKNSSIHEVIFNKKIHLVYLDVQQCEQLKIIQFVNASPLKLIKANSAINLTHVAIMSESCKIIVDQIGHNLKHHWEEKSTGLEIIGSITEEPCIYSTFTAHNLAVKIAVVSDSSSNRTELFLRLTNRKEKVVIDKNLSFYAELVLIKQLPKEIDLNAINSQFKTIIILFSLERIDEYLSRFKFLEQTIQGRHCLFVGYHDENCDLSQFSDRIATLNTLNHVSAFIACTQNNNVHINSILKTAITMAYSYQCFGSLLKRIDGYSFKDLFNKKNKSSLRVANSTPYDNKPKRIKITLCGYYDVGKHSLFLRCTEDYYDEQRRFNNESRILGSRVITFSGLEYELEFQYISEKTVADERLLRRIGYYHPSKRRQIHDIFEASIVIVCFDITNKISFENTNEWVEDIIQIGRTPMILVGCKADLEGERKISKVEAESFVEKNRMLAYFETSAKYGQGIDELFNAVIEFHLLLTVSKELQDGIPYFTVNTGLVVSEEGQINIQDLIKSATDELENNCIKAFLKLIEICKTQSSTKIDMITVRKLFASINFSTLTHNDQTCIFESIAGIPFKSLTILNSSILTDKLLIQIIRYCPELESLNITGCQNQLLYGSFTSELAKYCGKSLKRLVLSNTSIKFIRGHYETYSFGLFLGEAYYFEALSDLEIKNCGALWKVELKNAQALTVVQVDKTPNLTELSLQTTSCTLKTKTITCRRKNEWMLKSTGLAIEATVNETECYYTQAIHHSIARKIAVITNIDDHIDLTNPDFEKKISFRKKFSGNKLIKIDRNLTFDLLFYESTMTSFDSNHFSSADNKYDAIIILCELKKLEHYLNASIISNVKLSTLASAIESKQIIFIVYHNYLQFELSLYEDTIRRLHNLEKISVFLICNIDNKNDIRTAYQITAVMSSNPCSNTVLKRLNLFPPPAPNVQSFSSINIAVFGSAHVGKRNLVSCIVNDIFIDTYSPDYLSENLTGNFITPSGIDFSMNYFIYHNEAYFRKITSLEYPRYIAKSDIFIICFDITDKKTFSTHPYSDFFSPIASNISIIRQYSTTNQNDILIFLVGCKSDLKTKREVSKNDAEYFVNRYGLAGYFETSAKNNIGIQELLNSMVDKYRKRKNLVPELLQQLANGALYFAPNSGITSSLEHQVISPTTLLFST